MKIFLRNNRWSILWGLFILLLTLMPGNMIPAVPGWFDKLHPDKLVHLFIFSVFAVLLISGFRKDGNPGIIRTYALFWALLFSMFIGAFTELLQGWLIPLRTADWKDFAMDSFGPLGVVIACWAHNYLRSE